MPALSSSCCSWLTFSVSSESLVDDTVCVNRRGIRNMPTSFSAEGALVQRDDNLSSRTFLETETVGQLDQR
jgi:hypothetical protein